ncbi:MAG: trypsin-like peptidase domain-containing protein [Candidatus Babeliales bacterium]|jgi:serine protease Do
MLARFSKIYLFLIFLASINGVCLCGSTTNKYESNKNANIDWTEIFKDYKNAVVQIISDSEEYNYYTPYITGKNYKKQGSGFFISNDGYIITNYHVVENAISVEIQLPCTGKIKLKTTIEGVYPSKDLALLKLTEESLKTLKKALPGSKLTFFELGDSDALIEAEDVMIVGYPLGQENLKISRGQISGWEGKWIQTTAPVNSGNSGGPCLNKCGQVVGIVCMKSYVAEGIGYLISVNTLKQELQNLKENKVLHDPWLGLFVHGTTEILLSHLNAPNDGGIYVYEIQKNSLAYKSGIQQGDILYTVNGYKIDHYGYINLVDKGNVWCFSYVYEQPVYSDVKFVIYRNGLKRTIQLTLDSNDPFKIRYFYPNFDPSPEYEVIGGLIVSELTSNHLNMLLERFKQNISNYKSISNSFKYFQPDKLFDSRIIILGRLKDSECDKNFWISFGDIISKINGVLVKTIDDFRSAILKNYTNDYIRIELETGEVAILSVDEILKNEDSLAKRYLFTKSDLVEQLEEKRQQSETKTKTIKQKK